MTQIYELRKFEDDGSINTVLKISAEPKDAKREAKSYAEQIPGLYSLYKIEKKQCSLLKLKKNKLTKPPPYGRVNVRR